MPSQAPQLTMHSMLHVNSKTLRLNSEKVPYALCFIRQICLLPAILFHTDAEMIKHSQCHCNGLDQYCWY